MRGSRDRQGPLPAPSGLCSNVTVSAEALMTSLFKTTTHLPIQHALRRFSDAHTPTQTFMGLVCLSVKIQDGTVRVTAVSLAHGRSSAHFCLTPGDGTGTGTGWECSTLQ